MFKRSIFIGAIAIALFSLGAAPSYAQYAPVSGTIVIEKDGNATPAEGILVEVFRTDINAAGPTDKTDKNGRFAFAGLQAGAVVILAFSGPGASPSYLPAVRPGTENLKITLKPGDGKKLTEAEVRSAAAGTWNSAGGGQRELSEEDKKKQAEEEAKIKEIEEKNKKIEAATAIVTRTLEEGNAAFNAKDYSLAVSKYEEGIAADPEFVGSAPVLLNNRGTALRMRGINTYNAAVKNTDLKAREEGKTAARKDFSDSLESFHKAFTLLKKAQPGAIPDASVKEQTTRALEGAHATLKVNAQTEQVDGTKIDMAKTMLDAYVATQPDAAHQATVKIVLADLFRVSGDSDNAILVYKEVLLTDQNNVDAMAGAGLSLVNSGYMNDNKAQLQEGADFLQRFSEVAPANHKYLDDAKGLIQTLKAEQNIAPAKNTKSTTRRKN